MEPSRDEVADLRILRFLPPQRLVERLQGRPDGGSPGCTHQVLKRSHLMEDVAGDRSRPGVHQHERRGYRRIVEHGPPGHQATEGMPDKVDRTGVERLHHASQVESQLSQGVRRLVVERTDRLVLATLIHGHDSPTGFRQWLEDGNEVFLGTGEPRHEERRRPIRTSRVEHRERPAGCLETASSHPLRKADEGRGAHAALRYVLRLLETGLPRASLCTGHTLHAAAVIAGHPPDELLVRRRARGAVGVGDAILRLAALIAGQRLLVIVGVYIGFESVASAHGCRLARSQLVQSYVAQCAVIDLGGHVRAARLAASVRRRSRIEQPQSTRPTRCGGVPGDVAVPEDQQVDVGIARRRSAALVRRAGPFRGRRRAERPRRSREQPQGAAPAGPVRRCCPRRPRRDGRGLPACQVRKRRPSHPRGSRGPRGRPRPTRPSEDPGRGPERGYPRSAAAA